MAINASIAVGKKGWWEAFKESVGRIGRVSILSQQDELRAAAVTSLRVGASALVGQKVECVGGEAR